MLSAYKKLLIIAIVTDFYYLCSLYEVIQRDMCVFPIFQEI